MSSSPTARHGDALAVFDNERRIDWRRADLASWTANGVWPSPDEARDVRHHLAQCRPLLVVLDEPQTVVTLLAEEFATAAPAVIARVDGSSHEPMHVCIPALDWLPDDLRRRGLSFLDRSSSLAAEIPVPLRPAVVLEASDPGASHVRFAHRLRRSTALDDHLAAMVAYAFGDARDAHATR